MLPSNRSYAFWLALLRICVGGAWLVHGTSKFLHPDGFMPPSGAISKVVANGVANGSGPYHDFLANVVSPNIGLFAEAIRVGEVLVGCLLVLGFLTRLGGLGGMFLTLNYMLAQGELGSTAVLGSLDAATFLLSAVNVVLPTGRAIGLDWFFSRPRAVPVAVAVAPAAGPTVTAPGGAVQAEFVDERPLDGPSAPAD
ncbi:MAG TPA: TQO small subunit DoxD [Candidatus Baltobacteraceae bacterium]|jgi:thiosulfate dehydrogenase [quinone] large subunit